ncbi:MAG: oligosaccharide flippase family protein [Thermoleophilaceae bacterium]|nr:oligosaccharide flippase family protein [Thermoleophilaceae bacterium]
MNEFDFPTPTEIESEEALLAQEAYEKYGDRLRDDQVGGRVVRGSMVRVAGYGIGTLAIAASSIVLLRYLGVSDFGKYAVVMSLITIVSGITDAGFNTVGNRELALTKTHGERQDILGQLLGIRLVATPIGVLAAIAFTIAADYESTLILGTALAGVGATLVACSSAYSMALAVELRITPLTILETLKQVVPMIAALGLVVAGATLLPFFAIAIPGAIIALALTPRLAGRGSIAGPTFRFRSWGPLLRKAMPVAISTTIAVIYIRVLTILMFELSSDFETGLFSTSVRVIEMVLTVPWVVFAIALPVLSVANSEDRARTAYVFQRMVDVGIVFSTLAALAICFAADPIIHLIGGPAYDGAIPVLQIQAFSIIAAFVAQACMYATVAMEMMRELILANVIGLIAIVVIGVPMIQAWDAEGAAVAAVFADSITALVYIYLVGRIAKEIRPKFNHAWKPLLAGLLAGGAAYFTPGEAILQTIVAVVVFSAVALITKAIPSEVFDAISRKRAQSE